MIPRSMLFYKLASYGLSTHVIEILKLLYEDTSNHIWLHDELSPPFYTNQGVRQGCLLSPTLFSLYLNDLNDFLPGGVKVANLRIKLLMYADDLVLFAESPSELQDMIDAIRDYSIQWGLKVNLTKSKCMVFRECSRIPSSYNWKFGDENIEIVNEYKYLGMLLTYKLSYMKHLNLKLTDSKTAINATWLKYINNPRICISKKLKIYDACSRSIMFYGAQVWGVDEYDSVERLLRFFIKKLIFLPPNTPNYMIHIETDLLPQYLHTLRAHMYVLCFAVFYFAKSQVSAHPC